MFRRIEDIILTNQVNLKEMRAPEKCKLRSLRCSKLRATKLQSSELATASFGPLRSLELAAASSELGACVAVSFGARSLVAASSELGVCVAASSEQQASELGACCSKLRTSPELRTCCSKLRTSPELRACCSKLGARSLLAASSKLAAASSRACIATSFGARQALELSGAQSLLHERNASSGALWSLELAAASSK
jgi:hypothetical protein